MSTSPLKQLKIGHLRGATTPFVLSFDKKKKLTIVYGENATGKSTLCDALELLGSGRVGSLDNRGLGTTTKYWPSLGKTLADVSVELDTAGGDHRVRVSSQGVVVEPDTDRPVVEVLRRSHILSLIVARPADRYTAIRRFIDVTGIEESEASLKDAIKKVTADQSLAIARVQENRTALEGFWAQVGEPAPDVMSWATAAVADEIDFGSEVTALRALQTAFTPLRALVDRLQLAEATAGNALSAVTAAESAREHEAQRAIGGPVLALLEAAEVLFGAGGDPAACPLCGSAENVNGLRNAIHGQLSAMISLRQADDALGNAQQSRRSADEQLARDTSELVAGREAYVLAASSTNLPPDTPLPAASIPEALSAIGEWLDVAEPIVPMWEAAEHTRQDAELFYGTLRTALQTYRANVDEEAEHSGLLPRLEKTLAIVSEERHSYTDGVLSAIATEVGVLYERAHPGEGLAAISLALDPKLRASLDMTAPFGGRPGLPPQAYFSDSHLDTLGLCIFIAMAKQDAPTGTILVLDDVFASVDEPHVERLIEMVYDQAQLFRHCLITTHYKPWKEKYRWGKLKTGDIKFVELGKWTAAGGLTEVGSVPGEIEKLRILVSASPADPRDICGTAGVVLEAVFTFLVKRYRCRVPYDDGSGLTIGDLLQGFDTKLSGALMVQVKSATGFDDHPLGPIIKAIDNIDPARNLIGAHFNELAAHLPDADSIDFGTRVLEFADLIVDGDVGWPTSDASGSYWRNSSDTRRLHPLKRPA